VLLGVDGLPLEHPSVSGSAALVVRRGSREKLQAPNVLAAGAYTDKITITHPNYVG
jgi:hypothetical protein